MSNANMTCPDCVEERVFSQERTEDCWKCMLLNNFLNLCAEQIKTAEIKTAEIAGSVPFTNLFRLPMDVSPLEYRAALEALWNAVKSTDWQVGYNPEFTKACERLRELDRKRAE